MLSGYEIVLILALALIFFGAKKLPELARGLGKGMREFKKATREVTDQFHEVTSDLAHSVEDDRHGPPAHPAYEPEPVQNPQEHVHQQEPAGHAGDTVSGSAPGSEPDQEKSADPPPQSPAP